MKLFETSFFDGKSYRERFFNTETNHSEYQIIPDLYEYFIPNSTGDFRLITDQNLRLKRLEGNSKQSRDQIGVTNPIYKNIRDNYWKSGDYNLNPRILYLDIETRAVGAPDPENAPEQIILIQLLDSKNLEMYVLGLRPWKPESDYPLEYNVKYLYCKDEVQLLESFLKIFKALDPLIIYAWNGEGFDYPYLYNRIKKLGLNPNKLSNYGTVKLDVKLDKKNHVENYILKSQGHYFLDLMRVYKNFITDPRTSYSLDSIAEVEVHENKIEHDEFPTFDSFYTGEFYDIAETPFTERIRESIRQRMILRKTLKDPKEFQTNESNIIKDINFQFVYYGIRDVVLLKKIDDKLNFSKIISNSAKMMGVLFDDALSTVKPWSCYISNVAFLEKQAMPKREEIDLVPYVGAYVKEPVRGRHKWVMNFDVNSMYPQYSIAGFGMSPETLIPKAKMPPELREIVLKYFTDKTDEQILDIPQEVFDNIIPILKKYNISLCTNGVAFKKDIIGIIPRLVNQIYDQRKKDKKTMHKYEKQLVAIEQAIKERQ